MAKAEIPRIFKGSPWEEAEERMIEAIEKLKQNVDEVDANARAAAEKLKQNVEEFDSKARAAAERVRGVLDGMKANMALIKPVVTKLAETAKVNVPLPELVHKFTVDVPKRVECLGYLKEMLDQPPGEWIEVGSRKEFAADDRTCRIALAAYGPASLRSNALIAKKAPAGTDDFRFCICEYTALPEKDILYISDEREETMAAEYSEFVVANRNTDAMPLAALCPAFFVAIDHKSRSVVVSVRGTLTLADMMTDCIADAVPFPPAGRGVVAHSGIAKVTEMVRERSAAAVEAAAAASGYQRLLITGHSLGGATSHLLAISLAHSPQQPAANGRPDASLPSSITEIVAVAFGPPPYVSVRQVPCAGGGERAGPSVTLRAFVHDLDMIPRTSLRGMLLFASFLAGEESTCEDPDLYLPLDEVVVVRADAADANKMKFQILPGSSPLLSSGLLVPMMAGLEQGKPVEHHMPPQYDRMLREHRHSALAVEAQAATRGAGVPEDKDGARRGLGLSHVAVAALLLCGAAVAFVVFARSRAALASPAEHAAEL